MAEVLYLQKSRVYRITGQPGLYRSPNRFTESLKGVQVLIEAHLSTSVTEDTLLLLVTFSNNRCRNT